MIIQINTDKTINGDQAHRAPFIAMIEEELSRYSDHITRIEIHLSDENGKKDGQGEIRCMMEARLEGKQPIAVTDQANNEEQAVSGAIDKMKASLKTIQGRDKNH